MTHRPKFLIDENLPPALVDVFHQSGLEARHVNHYQNKTPISDNALRKASMDEGWIIVTRDDDFVKSYVNRKVPEKLIYVYNLPSKQEILDAFSTHLHYIVQLITENELIELNPLGVKSHF